MLYTPVKVTVAEDQLEKLKYPGSLDKPFLSIKIRLKGKKGEDEHTLLLTRGQIDRLIVFDLQENEHSKLCD